MKGRRLRRARLALGITQKYLAERAGLEQCTVNRAENGAYNTSLLSQARIARALADVAAEQAARRAENQTRVA